LSFDKRTLQIKQWTVTDPQGYDTTVILGPIDTGTEPDADLFVIPERVG
jgi:outer membrane lipoprotein-sorting protein